MCLAKEERMAHDPQKGWCYCRGVSLEYKGLIKEGYICFCLDCRQAQGSICAWNSPVDRSHVIIHGEGLLSEFSRDNNKYRVFCKACGSPVFSYRKDLPGVVRLRLGLFPEANHETLSLKTGFMEQKPSYINLLDN